MCISTGPQAPPRPARAPAATKNGSSVLLHGRSANRRACFGPKPSGPAPTPSAITPEYRGPGAPVKASVANGRGTALADRGASPCGMAEKSGSCPRRKAIGREWGAPLREGPKKAGGCPKTSGPGSARSRGAEAKPPSATLCGGRTRSWPGQSHVLEKQGFANRDRPHNLPIPNDPSRPGRRRKCGQMENSPFGHAKHGTRFFTRAAIPPKSPMPNARFILSRLRRLAIPIDNRPFFGRDASCTANR